MKWKKTVLVVLLLLLVSAVQSGTAAAEVPYDLRDAAASTATARDWSADAGAGFAAGQVPEQPEGTKHSLFERKPPGWNLHTIRSIYSWTVALPQEFPGYMQYFAAEGRLFGTVGSILLIIFVCSVFYSMSGQKRVFQRIEKELEPLWHRDTKRLHPRLASFIRIAVSPLVPLLLWAFFVLIEGFIQYKAPWFQPARKALALWAAGELLTRLFREILTDGLLPFCPRYGRMLFRMLRRALICTVAGMAVVWGIEAMAIPDDVKAFLRFTVSLAVISILSSLLMKKEMLLSLLPSLPYRSYKTFTGVLDRIYFPLAPLTFAAGILWCFGYRNLFQAILTKIWGAAAAFVIILVSYHFLSMRLLRWSERDDRRSDEAARFFFRSARTFLLYGTVAIAAWAIGGLLGLLGPLHDVLSVPVFTIGGTPLSFLILIEAGLILLAFAYVSYLLQAYLDYEVYPSVGIDTGLGYALDTFLKYLFYVIGFSAALRVLGLDLRVLMVFAGGVGIGTGIGLQHVAANVVSGFIIVFGRKLRKGDWIKVGDKLGMVTHIYLRATKIWTRDNIEYIVPNTDLITKPLVNYTLTSPIVRIYIPVGVSYDADPREVRKILLECAEKHQSVTQYRKPDVRIAEFGENSLNFELLVWIDISKIAEKDVRSRLYFTIIESLKAAGIEIPNPQRDIRIRSGPVPQMDLCNGSQKDSEHCRAVS